MLASFLCNGIMFGTINSFGVLYVALQKQFSDDPEAATKVSLAGSLAIGTTFFLSPVSGILSDRFGIRRTACFGGFVATLGMFLSAFSLNHVSR